MFRIGLFLLFICPLAPSLHANAAGPVAVVQELDSASKAKSEKYYSALRKRPKAGYLFDRFYDASLDWSSAEQLEKKLTDAVEKSAATNDRLLLAFFHSKQGNDTKALEQFRIVLKTDSGNAQVWHEKATLEARTLDFETALADLAKASEANPRRELATKIGQLRGKLLLRNLQSDQAIEVWKKLIADNPQDDYLAEEVIELQLAEGLYEQAEKQIDLLIAKTKDPFRKVIRQLRKGDIVQRSGRRDEAIKIYETTLSQVGRGTWLEREILGQIENVFRREENLVGLKNHYLEMLKANGNRLALRQSTARLMVELNLLEEATDEFKKIVELTPGNLSNREAYVNVLVKAEKFDLAIKQHRSMIQQNLNDPELRLKLAQLYRESNAENNAQLAANAVNEFVRISGDTEYAFLRAARLFDKFDDTENAAVMFKRCIKTFPQSETAKESWADHLYRHKKTEDAIAIWKSIAPQGCDRNRLIRVARLLSSRRENETAFAILLERFDDFKLNPNYLGQLCTEAAALRKYEQAVPWVLSRVRYSRSTLDLDSCLDQAVLVISKAGKMEEISDSLETNGSRLVAETCLLAELIEIEGESSKVDQLIQDAFKSLEDKPFADAKQQQQATQMLAGQRVRNLANRKDWTAATAAAIRQIGLPGGRKSNNVQQLVQFLLRDEKLESALTWIGEWKKISPGSLLPWLEESEILFQLDRTDESIRVLRQATRKFPDDIDLHMKLADRYLGEGQVNAAERIYWRRYEEAKNVSDKMRWFRELASTAHQQREMEELISKLNDRKKTSPGSIEPLLALAEAYRVADNHEGRRKALLEATRIQKDNLPLLLDIARLEESVGNWEKSIETLKRALPLDKTSTRTQERIASTYIRYGEPELGFDILLDLVKGSQSGAREIEQMAISILKSGEWDFARHFLQKSLPNNPDDYRLNYLAAVVDEQLGFTHDAVDRFVRLLGNSNEIAGLNKPTPASYQYLAPILPADTLELLALATADQSAHSHMANVGKNSRIPGVAKAHIDLALPNSCEQCQRFSLVHLKSIADSMDKDSKAEIAESVRLAGVNNIDFVFSMEGPLADLFYDTRTLALRYPDNEAVLALRVYALLTGDVELVMLKKGYETFKGQYPELAFLFAVHAAASDESEHGLLDAALADVDSLQPCNTTIRSVVNLVLENYHGQGQSNRLSKTQKETLSLHLSKWYFNKWYFNKQSRDERLGLFYLVSKAIERELPAEAWIQFLEEEIRNSQKAPPAPKISLVRGRRSRRIIQLIRFPPAKMDSFPTTVHGHLIGRRSQRFRYHPEEIDFGEKFGPLIPTIKNPTLRAMLKWQQIESEPLDNTSISMTSVHPFANEAHAVLMTFVDDLLATEKSDVNLYLVAAGLAGELKQWEKANALLEELRNLPLSRSMQETVDSAIVAIATQGIGADLKSDKNKDIVTSAKSAALRLRQSCQDFQQLAQLASAFEILGMKEDAEKLKRFPTASIVSPPTGFGRSVPSRYNWGAVSFATEKRLKELVSADKKRAAAHLLAKDFRQLAQASLDPNGLGRNPNDIKAFVARVEALGVEEEFLAKFEPGESTSSSKLAFHGFALEAFGKHKDAAVVYAKILETNRREFSIRLRLTLLELKQGKDISNRLEEFDSLALHLSATTFREVFRQNTMSPEEYFQLVESAVNHVHTKRASQEDLSWVLPLLYGLGNKINTKHGDLPYFYSAPGQSIQKEDLKSIKAASRKPLKTLYQKRKQLHDQSCRKLLDVPQLEPYAFSRLLRSAESAGEPIGDDFVKMATRAIINFNEPKRKVDPNNTASWSYGGKSITPERTPVEFLAREFGLKKTSNREQQVSSLRKKFQTTEKDLELKLAEFDLLLSLYSAAPAEFVDASNKALEDAGNLSRLNRGAPFVSVNKVIEIWSTTKPEVDLRDFLLEKSRAPRLGRWRPAQPYDLNKYLSLLIKWGQFDRVNDFLSRWSEQTLGPREEREKLAGLMPNQIPHDKRSSLDYYSDALKSFSQNQDFGLMVAHQFIVESGNTIKQSSMDSAIAANWKQHDDPDKFLLSLGRTSNFLGDVENFDPVVDKNGDTLLGAVIRRFNKQGLKFANGLNEKFKDRKDLTFGEQILQHAANHYEKPEGMSQLYATLSLHLDAIKAVPEEQQKKIAALVADLADREAYGDYLIANTEAEKSARDYFETLVGNSIQHRVEKLLAAKSYSDFAIQAYQLEDNIKALLTRLSREDDQWATCFDKGLDLINKTREKFPRDADYFLGRLINGKADYDWFRVVYKISSREESNNKVWLRGRTAQYLEQFFDRRYDEIKKEIGAKKKSEPIKASLQQLYSEMAEGLKDTDPAVFVPVFVSFLSGKINPRDHKEAFQWVEDVSKTGANKRLASSLKMAMHLFRTRRQCSNDLYKVNHGTYVESKRLDSPTDDQKELIKLLDSQELPFAARVGIALSIAQYESTMPAEGFWKSTDLLAKAFSQGFSPGQFEEANLFFRVSQMSNDSAFAAKAKTYADAWTTKYLGKDAQPYKDQQRFSGSQYEVYRTRYAIRLFQKLGQKQPVERLVSLARKVHNRDAIGTLIETGHFALARKVCRVLWQRREEFRILANPGSFTAKLEENLPSFIEQFPSERKKLLAEIFVASYPDTKNKEALPLVSQEKRLEKLAKRYSGIEFESTFQNQLAAVLLSKCQNLPTEVGESMRKYAGKVTASDLAWDSKLSRYGTYFQQDLFFISLAWEMRLGDPQRVQRSMEAFQTKLKPQGNRNNYDSMWHRAVNALRDPLDARVKNAANGELSALLPTLRIIGNPHHSGRHTVEKTVPAIALTAHVCAGEAESYRNWLKELKTERGASKQEFNPFPQTSLADCWQRLAATVKTQDKLQSDRARLDLIVEFWELANESGFEMGTRDFRSVYREDLSKSGLPAIIKAKLATPAEIVEIGPALAKIESVNGVIWRQIAFQHMALKQFDKAADCLKATIEDGKSNLSINSINCRVEYAWALSEAGKTEEAIKALKGIKKSGLNRDNQKRFPALQKKLGIE